MAGALPFPSRPNSARIVNRCGHWGAQTIIGTIVAAILLRVHPISPDSSLSVSVPVALMALVIASWLLMRKHDRRLCEHCLTAMPLNASEMAVHRRRRLATAHLGANKKLVFGYFAVLIGSAFIPGTIGLIIWSVAQASLIYLLLSYTTHRTLQPWCPACRGRGEGESVDAPEPVPQGSQRG